MEIEAKHTYSVGMFGDGSGAEIEVHATLTNQGYAHFEIEQIGNSKIEHLPALIAALQELEADAKRIAAVATPKPPAGDA